MEYRHKAATEDKRIAPLAYIGTMEESKQKMLEALQAYGGIEM
jgi:hypothetical protein